jgi:DHA3 family macrolide efflux protein-like MFS transporter
VLATATLVSLLPQVLAGPFIGVLVDRWDRKRIMVVADLSIAVVTAGLVALFVAGVIPPWHIYLASPSRVAAPPLGALALGVLPVPAVLAVDIVTAAIAVSCLAAVAIPRPEPSAVGASVSSGKSGVLAGGITLGAWEGSSAGSSPRFLV